MFGEKIVIFDIKYEGFVPTALEKDRVSKTPRHSESHYFQTLAPNTTAFFSAFSKVLASDTAGADQPEPSGTTLDLFGV